MVDRVDLLIGILFDPMARIDEKDDAAMDLGRYDDDRALDALIKFGSNFSEEDFVMDVCGEAIAAILVRRNEFRKDLLNHLTPIAKHAAYGYIQASKPQWLQGEVNDSFS